MAPLSKLTLTADELPPLVDQLDLLFEMVLILMKIEMFTGSLLAKYMNISGLWQLTLS